MTARRLLVAGAVAGMLLVFAPIFGLIGATIGMHHAVTLLGVNGISDPHALSSTVAATLGLTAGGLVLCPVGMVLLVVCLWLLQRPRASQPPPLPRFRGDQG